MQQRALSKDKYPGWFDLAAGGVLREGEDYRSNAVREVEEELGITGAEMVDHGEFCVDHRDNRCWGRLFSMSLRAFQFADGEVIGGFFTTSEKVLDGTLHRLPRFHSGAPSSSLQAVNAANGSNSEVVCSRRK